MASSAGISSITQAGPSSLPSARHSSSTSSASVPRRSSRPSSSSQAAHKASLASTTSTTGMLSPHATASPLDASAPAFSHGATITRAPPLAQHPAHRRSSAAPTLSQQQQQQQHAQPWAVLHIQPAVTDIRLKHGVISTSPHSSSSATAPEDVAAAAAKPAIVGGESGDVALASRLRYDAGARRVCADFDFAPSTWRARGWTSAACVSCRTGASYLEVDGGEAKGEEVWVSCAGKVRARIGRWAVRRCLVAAMRHNAAMECGCSLVRIAGRELGSVPVVRLGAGVEDLVAMPFETPVGWTVGATHGRSDSVVEKALPGGGQGDGSGVREIPTHSYEDAEGQMRSERVGEGVAPAEGATTGGAEGQATATPKGRSGLVRTCCDSGSARAEIMAMVHDVVCSCGGLGRRKRWSVLSGVRDNLPF